MCPHKAGPGIVESMFASGLPNSFSAHECTFICASPNGAYISCITSKHVCVYSSRERLALGSLAFVEGNDLSGATVAWKASSDYLAVLASEKLFVLSVKQTSQSASAAAQEQAPRRIDLSIDGSFPVPCGQVLCSCRGDFLIVGGSDGTVKKVSWQGREVASHSLQSGVTSCSASGKLVACACASGCVEVICLTSRETSTIASIPIDSTVVSFHPNGYYLALGARDGVAHIYRVLPQGGLEICGMLRDEVDADQNDKNTAESSYVSCMHWCPDGSCHLAVGYSARGFSVWSARTRKRLLSTVPKIKLSDNFTSSEVCARGSSSIAWASHGYQLYVLENRTERMLMFEMVKCSRKSSIVHGADYLVIVEQRGADEDEQLRRTRIQMPAAYMNNWPIRYVAASPRGDAFAVAGRRGFAVYNRSRDRWRLFGNVSQEQNILCCALLWYHTEILCVVDRSDSLNTRMLLYPRSHLDNQSILATVTLLGKPLAMDASAEKETIIIRYRASLVVYRVAIDDDDVDSDFDYPRFVITPIETVPLADVPLTVDILPRGGCRRAGVKDFSFAKAVCLDMYGRATIVDTESGAVESLLCGVHKVFCHNFARDVHRACSSAWPSSFDHCLFLVTATRVELWVAAVDPNHENRFGENVFASITNAGAHFLGVTASTAALVSISQKTYYVLPDTMPSFEIESHIRPCLDVLLGWILTWYGVDTASKVLAASRSRFTSIDDAVELLIHKAAMRKVEDASSAELNGVIKLIDAYPPHEKAGFIVRLVRKMESSDWNVILDLTESPLSMFEVCVQNNSFRNAAGCMVLLRQLGGGAEAEFASALAKKLMEVADKVADDEVLVSELTAYCKRFAGKNSDSA